MSSPQRAFVLTLQIGADTAEGLVDELLEVVRDIEVGGLSGIRTFGGPTAGGNVELLKNGTTHAEYFEQLGAYLKEKSA